MAILVIGMGGIGGTLAGRLAPGNDVHVYTRSADLRASIAEQGIELVGANGQSSLEVTSLQTLPETGSYRVILVATQPPQVVEAARSVVHLLADDGHLVTFQNGLPEQHAATIVGEHRAIGCVVGWGASMSAPGVYDQTSKGPFTLSSAREQDDLATLLQAVAPVKRVEDFLGARWAKLAFNCAISTLGTIGGDRLGALASHRFVRRLALEIFTEVVNVTQAEGITVAKLGGTVDLQWMALTPSEVEGITPALLAKHATLLAVATKYRRLRSSMLYALERGRPPAVDFLNGEVLTLAAKHGLSTPVNQAALDCVHAIARGEKTSSLQTLQTLFEATRPGW